MTALIQRAQKVPLQVPGGPQLLERSAYRVLGHIYDQGPLRLTDLATAFALDLSTVSRQLGTLQEAGLVHRYQDPTDQRAFLLATTPEGREVLERTRAARRQVLQDVLGAWPGEDVDTLARLLERFNAGLRARSPRPGEKPGSPPPGDPPPASDGAAPLTAPGPHS